jgi:hypothetical protein
MTRCHVNDAQPTVAQTDVAFYEDAAVVWSTMDQTVSHPHEHLGFKPPAGTI